MDWLSDMISRIKNAQKRQRLFVDVFKSRFCGNVLDCLTREGFIRGYVDSGKFFRVYLKYKSNKPVIEECIRISKPSSRVYYSAEKLRKNFFNNNLIVYTSNKGVFLNNKFVNQGGEALFKIK